MKVKLLTTISFFTYQLSTSQTEKLLHGKVFSENILLKNVEVINKTSKISTKTNEAGEFSILVAPKDSLIFFSKNYFFKRLKISYENINQNNIVVNMIPRPEELDEVVVKNIIFPHVGPADENSTVVPRSRIDHTGVYNGSIANGMDFVAIFNLFRKKDKRPKHKFKELNFKELADATVPLAFFSNQLKLTPEEKDLFLQFCDADPQSKVLVQQKNLLFTMDFLYTKNIEFQKLKTEPKN